LDIGCQIVDFSDDLDGFDVRVVVVHREFSEI